MQSELIIGGWLIVIEIDLCVETFLMNNVGMELLFVA
jgi:hypothetical protein